MNTKYGTILCRIAFPVVRDLGLESVVSGHFGKAPGFYVVNSDGTEGKYFDAANARYPGECAPVQALRDNGTRAIMARGIGRGAMLKCHNAGIQIFEAQARTVAACLEKYEGNGASDFPDKGICDHHHNSEGHSCC